MANIYELSQSDWPKRTKKLPCRSTDEATTRKLKNKKKIINHLKNRHTFCYIYNSKSQTPLAQSLTNLNKQNKLPHNLYTQTRVRIDQITINGHVFSIATSNTSDHESPDHRCRVTSSGDHAGVPSVHLQHLRDRPYRPCRASPLVGARGPLGVLKARLDL